jgi:2-methylcitrate dehydratase PrpD
MSTATTAMPGAGPVTRLLTEGLVELAARPLPPEVAAAATESLLEAVTSAIEGSGDPAVGDLVRVLTAQHGTGSLPLLGRSERLGVLAAATVNGAAARGLRAAGPNGGDPAKVAPEATAMATTVTLGALEGSSGEAVLRAFALGCEAQARMSAAMQPQHHAQGWNATSSTATIGATLAAGVLVGLDADTLAHGVGIGMSQTTGSRQADGSLLEPFMAGKGAANGIHSVLMARAGITSTKIALEHVRGFYALVSLGEARLDEVTDGLGERWRWLESRPAVGADAAERVERVLPGAGAALVTAVSGLAAADDLRGLLAATTPGGAA